MESLRLPFNSLRHGYLCMLHVAALNVHTAGRLFCKSLSSPRFNTMGAYGASMHGLVEQVRGWGVKEAAVFACTGWLVYWMAVGIYRVYFHPLAKIPGPKVCPYSFLLNEN